eukprot:GHVS01080603.1.p1 GENE.GHVS01080603.1~~GHVS01080603.1.p1  ORF type:complete len:233 (+),score=14.56 GHVS01080603.1:167-865(+)
MGFVRVVCPFVIVATLLLLSMVTVSCEVIQLGNVDISFVSTSEAKYPKLLVMQLGGREDNDYETVKTDALVFKNVGLKKAYHYVNHFIMEKLSGDKKPLLQPLEVGFDSNDLPIVWEKDEIFHINQMVVQLASNGGGLFNALHLLWSILELLPNMDLEWENIKSHIMFMLLARNAVVREIDVKKYRVRCVSPIEAEREFRDMLKRDSQLRVCLKQKSPTEAVPKSVGENIEP